MRSGTCAWRVSWERQDGPFVTLATLSPCLATKTVFIAAGHHAAAQAIGVKRRTMLIKGRRRGCWRGAAKPNDDERVGGARGRTAQPIRAVRRSFRWMRLIPRGPEKTGEMAQPGGKQVHTALTERPRPVHCSARGAGLAARHAPVSPSAAGLADRQDASDAKRRNRPGTGTSQEPANGCCRARTESAACM